MARVKYQNFAVDDSGDVISGAAVEVRDSAGTLATLYAAETGSTQAYSGVNPFTAGDGDPDKIGSVEFWVEEGAYTVAVGSGSSQVTYRIEAIAQATVAAAAGAAGPYEGQGGWDASSGSFPSGSTAMDLWEVETAGTVDSVSFAVGDQIVALVDSASTGTYAANWFKKAGGTVTQDDLDLKANAADPAFTGDGTAENLAVSGDLTVGGSAVTTAAYVDEVGHVDASYSNAGGQGDRTSIISVTASAGLIFSGTASNLVDGATGNNTTDSVVLNAVSVSGHYLQFDFGYASEKVVREVTFEQSGTQTHGAWKWQGSDDASDWTDIGSSFTLGGATSQTQTELSDNVTGYRYYRLLGVSGTASGGPYVHEAEFKIVDALTSGYAKRTEISPFPADFPTGKLIAAYFFDEAGEGVVNDAWAGFVIDLTGPTDPNATVTAHGVKLSAGLIETPELPGCQSQTLLYRTDYGGTSNGFVISGGSASGQGALQRNLTTSESHYIAGFGLGWFEPQMGSGGGAAYAMCSGQWALYHREDTAARNSIYGLGGRHSTTTSRCNEFEAGAAFFWNDTLTDAERDAVLLFVRQRAAARGVYIHRADPPEQANLYMVAGESNADGRALITDLSAGDQAADYRHTMIAAAEAPTRSAPVDGFELGYNQKYYNSGFSVGTYVGPEIGVAKQRRADYLADRKRAVIYKNGKGGSQIAPTSTGVSAANTWNASEAADGTGLFWSFIRQMQIALAGFCDRGVGFGDTVRVGLWIGLNDATDTAYTTDAATYQSYLQDWLDTLEEYLPGMTVEVEIFRAHNSDPSSDATALGHVRTATDDFATANSNVTATDTDAYGLEADSVHYDAAANVTMGATLHG